MSLSTETSRVPFPARLAALPQLARSAVAVLACVAGAALLGGCATSGACVTGENIYFCQEDSLEQCQEFWCDDDWASCSFFASSSCADLGFPSESEYLTSFSTSQTPDWTLGGVSGGGGPTSSTGACAYYDGTLNRVLCESRSSSACSGKFMGSGTSCAGMTCTSSTNPFSCTVPGAGGGGGGGGGGGSGDTCSNTWTCAYDGQATPMCSWACSHTGTERTQSCQVLASYMTSGNAGECCTVCR